jgi:hypothetical protein
MQRHRKKLAIFAAQTTAVASALFANWRGSISSQIEKSTGKIPYATRDESRQDYR